MLVTIAAPLFFAGRFDSHPDIGMALWFISLLAAMLATVGAVGIASWSIFETWLRLSESADLGFTLAASVAPWLLLAVAGILMALVNQRLAPLFQVASEIDVLAHQISRAVTTHRGVPVIELDLPGYFAVTRNKKIYLSKAAFKLPQRQLDAVLRHEMGHIKLHHESLKRCAYLIYQLLPWVAAARALRYEVDRLCELSADKYALRKVYSKDLHEARRLFTS